MIDTDEYRRVLEGRARDFLNRGWRDNPHRLVFNLCAEIDRLRAELEAMRARGGDRARLTCPRCHPIKRDLPAMRCMTCGTAFNDEEVDR